MLGWVFKPKKQHEQATDPTPAVGAEGDLEFLRSRSDFDAEEMATVHGQEHPGAVDNERRSALPDVDDPGITRPAIRVPEGLCFPQASVALRAAATSGGELGELVLSVQVHGRSKVISVHDLALIGRADADQALAPELDLSADDAVSRRHARIFRRGGQFWIRDLDSTNGTRLNGNWLTANADVPLHSGDLVELGEASELRVIDISFGVELTDEDQQLSELLDEAIGIPPASDVSPWPLSPADSKSVEGGVDLLNLALSRGAEAGLLPAAEAEIEPPAAAPQWRLQGLGDIELPSYVEPYR